MVELSTNTRKWVKGIHLWITLFVLLFMVTFPFSHDYLPDPGGLFSSISESMIRVWRSLFGLEHRSAELVPEDSVAAYLHTWNVFVLSGLGSIAILYLEKGRINWDKFFYWTAVVMSYYLAVRLLDYGFNKVFKWQFYQPEPNTLYTTIGNTPKDLLYWSSMGSSRTYTMFSGIVEVMAGGFLLFQRTRLIGALFALGIMTNVVMINFGFDISVKLFSSFLLLVSVILVVREGRGLLTFLLGGSSAREKPWRPSFEKHRNWYLLAKGTVIAFMLFGALAMYFETGNFNDDLAERPPLHGAYEVESFSLNGEEFSALMSDRTRWKRVFVHRQGYFITQSMQDDMWDYELRYDDQKRLLELTDYRLNEVYVFQLERIDEQRMKLVGQIGGASLEMTLRKLPLEQLPLLQNEFHWTIDEIAD